MRIASYMPAPSEGELVVIDTKTHPEMELVCQNVLIQ